MTAYRLFSLAVLLAGGILHATGVVANENSPKNTKEKASTKKTSTPQIVYVPPVRGAPTTRTTGAGTRGSYRHEPLNLLVMAPDQTGWASTHQPTLYWYINQELLAPVEITLISEEAEDPLLETILAPTHQMGFHDLSLKDHHVQLKPGIEYQWFVSAVVDAEHRSNDILASGAIQYMTGSEPFNQRLANQSASSVAMFYASEGYWYDAIHTLETEIKHNPDDSELRKQKAQLLSQEKLLGAFFTVASAD